MGWSGGGKRSIKLGWPWLEIAGSDQGKKRKRQDPTKESQSEDIKVSGAKERKKAKHGEQVECDAENVKGKRSKTASTGRNEQKNESTDGKAHNLYQNSGKR